MSGEVCPCCATITRTDDHVLAAGVTGVPATGAWLVIDGEVREVIDKWPANGPTRDGRIRWGVVTKDEGDEL